MPSPFQLIVQEGQGEGIIIIDMLVIELDLPPVLVPISPQKSRLFSGLEVHVGTAQPHLQLSRALAEGDYGGHILSGGLA